MLKFITILIFTLIVSIVSQSSSTTNRVITTTTSPPIFCQNDFGLNKLNGSCSSIDNCLGGAYISKTCGSLLCCIYDVPSRSTHNLLTRNIFLKVVGNTPRNNWIYGHLVDSFKNAQLGSDLFKIAAYVSQLVGETDSFKAIESKTPEKDNDPNIGNNQAGDGSNYRGRGAILLRGRENYNLAPSTFGVDFLLEPEKAALPSYAFKLGAWFWTSNAYVIMSSQTGKKDSLNLLADGTFFSYTMLTHSLTSNLQSLKFRANVNELILKELNSVTLKRGQGIVCSIGDSSNQNETGVAVPICLDDFKKPYCGCEGTYEMRSCPYGFNYLSKCRNSALVKCCIEKCKATLDLALLADSSGSITPPNYEIIRNFSSSIVSNLPIGINDTRVAFIDFNYLPKLLIDFSVNTSTKIVLDIIKNIIYVGGGTRTDLALKKAYTDVFNEANGMRPIKEGVPKVIIVITDGLSNYPELTKVEAIKTKERGLNVIAVGIKGANRNELLTLASTTNDVYFVDEFYKVLQIVQSLTRTTCQQPAEIVTQDEIQSTVAQNAYKYFKLSLIPQNKTNQTLTTSLTYLEEFTIELKKLSGDSELFYSFDEENPKSDSDYVKDDNRNEKDENFIDKPKNLTAKLIYERKITGEIKQDSNRENSKNDAPGKYYPVRNTDKKEFIYFSVKGFSEVNEFKINIYEEYIENEKPTSNTLTIVLAVVFSLLGVFIICVAVYFSIKRLGSEKRSDKGKPVTFTKKIVD